MYTLRELFGDSKPKCTRNFVKENIRQVREIQRSLPKREEIDCVSGKPRAKKFQNVPARRSAHVNDFQSNSNEQNTKKISVRIPRVSESSSKTLGGRHSSPVGHVTEVGITKKGHVKTKRCAPKENEPKRNKGSDTLGKSDVAEFVNQQHMNISQKGRREVSSSTELSLDMSELLSVGSERDLDFSTDSRNIGCQTVDPKNFDKLYDEGVIMYPSSRKPPGSKLRRSEKMPPTCEVAVQTERVPSPVSRRDNAAGDSPVLSKNSDFKIQKSSLSELKDGKPEEESTEIDYMKRNARCGKMRQRSSDQAESNPLTVYPSYQRGVNPKYLQECCKKLQKEAEQDVQDSSDPACPPGHVLLPESERTETLTILWKSRKVKQKSHYRDYADLIEELNRIPLRIDTLRVCHRKMELEKQLKKIEEGIKVFSRPKVFVNMGV